MIRFRRFALAKGRDPEIKKNKNKDSTETKKTIKDSDRIRNLLIIRIVPK